jgi:hypothetical protein
MQISRLRVSNEDFLVSSMIERCPKSMMLRELVKNAVEAASRATSGGPTSGGQRVEITPLSIDGHRKLSIWNTGPGMDASELYRMCDIASSIGKENALDQNFGMGAKVASLPSNHHGIRYRSCKAGRIHQVLMGKRDDMYGRLRQLGPDGEFTDVLDVTDTASAEGQDPSFDWTQVVLLGHRPEQDTVANPYDGNPGVSPSWIAEELYARFFTWPSGITLTLHEGCHTGTGARVFEPIGARTTHFERYEAIPIERGIVLHYFFDAPDPEVSGQLKSARGALQPAHGTAALVHRGEVYDARRPNWVWTHEAPVYGIPFGARYFSVFVELPDDFPLLPDGYRQFLRHVHNLQHHVTTREFAALVVRHRPAWLLELLRSFAPDARHTEPLLGEMASLFKKLRVARRWWPPGGDGEPPPDGGDGEMEYEVAPQIVPLRDEADLAERGMNGKIARFYSETHQLFVNTLYPGLTSFRSTLEQEFATVEDQEEMRRVAMVVSEQLITRQVCRKLVFGLSKRETWGGWEVDQATSMYSLTLVADDNAALLEEAREEMRRQLGDLCPTIPDPRVEQVRGRFAAAMEELMALRPRQVGAEPLELFLRLA